MGFWCLSGGRMTFPKNHDHAEQGYIQDVLGMDPDDVRNIQDCFFNCFDENYRREQLQKRSMQEFSSMF